MEQKRRTVMDCYKQKRRTMKDCYKQKSRTLMNCYKQKRRRLKDCYFLDSVIGEGGFGKVHDGVRIEDGTRVAIKFVAKNKVTDWTTMSGTKVPMELMLLDRVQAVDGVIKLLEYFEEKNGFFYVMEHPKCKDLYEYIRDTGALDEYKAHHFFKQIVETVVACHRMGVFHRDIKSENILVDMNTNKLRLIDFGCGAKIWSDTDTFSSFDGTLFYAPPEQVNTHTYQAGPATVWTLGLILYEMVCRKLPFNFKKDRKEQILSLPSRLVFNRRLSSEVRDLITRCLNPEAENRIDLNDILEHPWMTWKEIIQPFFYNFQMTIQTPPQMMNEYELSPFYFNSNLPSSAYLNSDIPSPDYLNAIIPNPAPVMPSSQNQQHPLGQAHTQDEWRPWE